MPEPASFAPPFKSEEERNELQRLLAKEAYATTPWPELFTAFRPRLTDSLLRLYAGAFGETDRTRAAETRIKFRAIYSRAEQLPKIDVHVERSTVAVKPIDLCDRYHVKLLTFYKRDSNDLILSHASRIGEDGDRLRNSLATPHDSWLWCFDTVKQGLFPNFRSTYEMKRKHVYDGLQRGDIDETYFAHDVTLSRKAHEIWWALMQETANSTPDGKDHIRAIFAVSSSVPRFLSSSETPDPDATQLWSSMPEFDIYLLENPHDPASPTVERLTFREFDADGRDVSAMENGEREASVPAPRSSMQPFSGHSA